jgi:serine/threonine-protein kinase
VAPPWKPPEAARRDFFVTGEVALVAPATLSEKGEAAVKNPQQKQQKGLGPVGKAITTGTACLTVACTGPQVRPEPLSEPCPPGAVQAMADLNIDIGDEATGVLPGRGAEVISVRGGWTSVRIAGAFEELPPAAILKGRLLFGDKRVYGRFTEAQERNGTRTWPVCMELLNTDGEQGLAMKPGSTTDTAKVFSTVLVKAVDRFK